MGSKTLKCLSLLSNRFVGMCRIGAVGESEMATSSWWCMLNVHTIHSNAYPKEVFVISCCSGHICAIQSLRKKFAAQRATPSSTGSSLIVTAAPWICNFQCRPDHRKHTGHVHKEGCPMPSNSCCMKETQCRGMHEEVPGSCWSCGDARCEEPDLSWCTSARVSTSQQSKG